MSVPRITRRPETVWLYQGDDQERLDLLRQAVEDAGRPAVGNRRWGATDDAQAAHAAAVEAHDAFLAEAKTRAVVVQVTALGRKQWRDLCQEHPAREDNDVDKNAGGVNADTFPDALLNAHDPEATITAVRQGDEEFVFDSAAERVTWLADLSDAHYGKLYTSAFWVNKAQGADPKELRVSAPTRSGSET